MVVHEATPILVTATIVFTVWRFFLWRRNRGGAVREVGVCVFFVWVLFLVWATFFPMVIIFYDWSSGVNLIPFASIRQLLSETVPSVAIENIVGNVVLFVPFGLMLPLLFSSVRSWGSVAWRAAVVSLAIELAQWVTGARATDVDDLLLNTVGAVVGYGLYRVVVILAGSSTFLATLLDRLAAEPNREPLTAGIVPLGVSVVISIPLLVTPLISGTIGDGVEGILQHAMSQHAGSSVLARGDFEEHTYVVVGTEEGISRMTMVGFERVLAGRFTWVSTSEPLVGDDSRYHWSMTAFNVTRDEVPLLVVWGRNEAGASQIDVATDRERHSIPIGSGVFVAATPIDPDGIASLEFVFRSADGADLSDEYEDP